MDHNNDNDRIGLKKLRGLVISTLKKKSSMNAVLSNVGVDELTSIIDRLQSILATKMCDEISRREAEMKFFCLMDSSRDYELNPDFTPRLLHNKARVRYMKDGQTWSGVGRRPEPFRGLSSRALEQFRV